MKTTLILVSAFQLLSLSAFSADPVVIVRSATSVTVDGVEAGRPADTIRNRPELASAIQRALEKWDAARTAEIEKLRTASEAKAARVPALLKQKLEAERATGEGPKTRLLESLIAEAEKPEKAARKQALLDEIAAKQREAASLE